MDVRTQVDITPRHYYHRHYRIGKLFKLKKPRTRARHSRYVSRGSCNDKPFIYAYCPTSKGYRSYYENDVDPADWAEIVTEGVLAELPVPDRTPCMVPGYKVNNRISSTPITKVNKGHYQIPRTTVTRDRMIAICKAVLEDEGYMVIDSRS